MEMAGTNSFPFYLELLQCFKVFCYSLQFKHRVLFNGKRVSTFFFLDFNTFRNCLENPMEKL